MTEHTAFEVEKNGARLRFEGSQTFVDAKTKEYEAFIVNILEGSTPLGENLPTPMTTPIVHAPKKVKHQSAKKEIRSSQSVDSDSLQLRKEQIETLKRQFTELGKTSVKLTKNETVFQIGVFLRDTYDQAFTHIGIESAYRQIIAARVKLPLIKNRDRFSQICRDLSRREKNYLWFEKTNDEKYMIAPNGELHLGEIHEELTKVSESND